MDVGYLDESAGIKERQAVSRCVDNGSKCVAQEGKLRANGVYLSNCLFVGYHNAVAIAHKHGQLAFKLGDACSGGMSNAGEKEDEGPIK